ncbi:MAG: GatB/YqeY domain-containing protein [Pseudomonadota bacterium]
MSIRDELSTALKEALKNKDQVTMATVRLIMAALKDRDIAARGNGKEQVEENEILSMLQSMIKQRKESAATYADAGREELAEREQAEIQVIEKFLPQQMSDAEVDEAISAIITEVGASNIKDMGKVMGQLKTKYAGQIDMAKAGGLVKEKLSA